MRAATAVLLLMLTVPACIPTAPVVLTSTAAGADKQPVVHAVGETVYPFNNGESVRFNIIVNEHNGSLTGHATFTTTHYGRLEIEVDCVSVANGATAAMPGQVGRFVWLSGTVTEADGDKAAVGTYRTWLMIDGDTDQTSWLGLGMTCGLQPVWYTYPVTGGFVRVP